jgi:phage shock protein C
MTASDEKKWKKSKSDRMIGGVCGGLASYFHLDPTLVRIVWAVSVFFNGLGVIAYLVALVVLPTEETDPAVSGAEKKSSTNIWLIAGILLIFLGLSWGMHNWGWRHRFPFWEYHWFGFGYAFWPALLIVLGVFYLVYIHKDRKSSPESSGSADASSKPRWPFRRTINGKMISGVAVVALWTSVFFWVLLYVVAVIAIPTE